MGEHDTWFSLIPGFKNLETWASHYLIRETGVNTFATQFSLTHVAITALITLLLVLAAIRYRARVRKNQQDRLLPERTLGIRNLFELLIDIAMSLVSGVMGREKAQRYFPVLGAVFFFILFNNLIGLVPGFIPATDTLKTNAGLAVMVFILTHAYGVRTHGVAPYIRHFVDPVLGLPWPLMIFLVPLFFAIEMVSHIVRPLSLSLRLMGNMVGDHKVLAAFFALTPWLVPLPFYLLGILVCVVQTVVFTLLSAVYFDLATAEAH